MNTKAKTIAQVAATIIGIFFLFFFVLWGFASLSIKIDMSQQQTRNGTTALMYAAQHNYVSDVRHLLHDEAWVDARDKDGDTALSLAAAGGHNQVVRMLIDAGADLENHDKDGYTPVKIAAMRGNDATVRILLRAGAHSDRSPSQSTSG